MTPDMPCPVPRDVLPGRCWQGRRGAIAARGQPTRWSSWRPAPVRVRNEGESDAAV